MTRDKKIQVPKPLDTVTSSKSKAYKKPRIHVVGKTASLIRGDYGNNDDNYRRYQD